MRSTEIKSVASRVDCMTTSVAIAAQYASGNPKRRATASEIVAAIAVRIECTTDGRFCGSHFQSFTSAIFLTGSKTATSISHASVSMAAAVPAAKRMTSQCSLGSNLDDSCNCEGQAFFALQC